MKKIFLTIVFLIFSLNSFAELSLSPISLNFNSQALNTTSAEKLVILENVLRGELNITNITVSGDFAKTDDCGNSVAPSSNCTIRITFTPTTAGTRNGTLTVSSDSDTGQVTLTGIGEEVIPENQKPIASFTVTPESGNAPLTVSLNASKSTDLDGNETIENYQWVSSDGQSISDGKTTSVTFDTNGSYTITLTITDDKDETDTEEETVIVTEKAVDKFTLGIIATNGTVKCSTDGRKQDNCESKYDEETSLTITAEPDKGYEFTSWADDCSGTGDCQLTMSANKTVTANFSESEVIIEKFNLETTANNGTVKCSTDGRTQDNCQSKYDKDTSLIITAEPEKGYEFTSWSDYCSDIGDCKLTMDADKIISAKFELIDIQKPTASFTITVDSDNPLKVDLDASNSSGTITSYEWASTDIKSVSDGKTTSIIFNEAGSYEITLTVTDDKEKTDTEKQFIIVGYPQVDQVFSIGDDSDTTTAQFYGGISLNDGSFISKLTSSDVITKGKDTIAVEGIIVPVHTGQAEIIVVGLYTPPSTEIVEDRCNPANGYYYMITDNSMTNNYCQWDVAKPNEWCNDLNRTSRRRENTEYATRWDGKLDSLQPLFTNVELINGQPINLTKDKTLYKDVPAYTGHICLTFGYRLDDIIVFNGDPIEFDVVK